MNKCYFTLGKQLDMDEDENGPEDNRVKGVEVGRAHYDIGFSLADKECWEAAIEHWEKALTWDITGRAGRLPPAGGKVIVHEFDFKDLPRGISRDPGGGTGGRPKPR